MYDLPTKNKKRANRRKAKAKFRSPYAKELETHKYRQRIKEHKTHDDDYWKEDLEDYLYGTRDMEGRDSTKESPSSTLSTEIEISGRRRDGELVESHRTTQGQRDSKGKGD